MSEKDLNMQVFVQQKWTPFLMMVTLFNAVSSMNEFADDVWKAVDGGFVQAVSVGFLPLDDPGIIRDDEDRFTGFEFDNQELLELSVVPVPANPSALAVARALAISERSQRLLFDDDGRALARVAASKRRNSLTLARLRPGFFNGGRNVVS